MKKFSKNVILAFSFFALAGGSSAIALETQPKNVLILHSMEYGLPSYDLIVDKIRTHLRSRLDVPLNFYAEYLDIVRFRTKRIKKGSSNFTGKNMEGKN